MVFKLLTNYYKHFNRTSNLEITAPVTENCSLKIRTTQKAITLPELLEKSSQFKFPQGSFLPFAYLYYLPSILIN